ncbi:hypothetical protein BD410DRAFT_734244 [Rickenella mellea]|uniref:Uncharacterized protein n=1 Tax=Rickenella mellea TaxID=50990 RepID=A0A4Y7PIU8_9AGAM|nr:hypothetical protein BD410DRAFT_734244 [Rickenella mellea]
MVQDGPRGIQALLQPPDDPIPTDEVESYGIDWAVNDDPTLMTHLLESNPQDWDDQNPFGTPSTPSHLSHVPCDPPNCPFTNQEVELLGQLLHQNVDLSS